ncbi:MAG: MFS transporter [Oscillospiraceae bacterium]
MRKAVSSVIFLKSAAVGIIMPVLSLVLLAHGASMATLSLLLGAYSLTVIVAELPSGIMADVFGRKRLFMLSAVLYAGSFLLLLFSNSLLVLLGAMVLNGLGRAFSTGSIDALAIDQAVENGTPMEKVTARISMLESAGLAGGALLGGVLAGIGAGYFANIFACLCLYTALFLATALGVKEDAVQIEIQNDHNAISKQIKNSFAIVRHKSVIKYLFAFSFLSGVALLLVETYWQPALIKLLAPEWLLGGVVFLGFAGSILGSKLSQALLSQKSATGWWLLIIQKIITGAVLILLAAASTAPLFTGTYTLLYLLLGSSGVVENTLLNKEIESAQRASVVSLFSFIMQLGGLAASLLSWAFIPYIGYTGLWGLGGIVLCAGAGGCALLRSSLKSKQMQP